MTTHRTTKTILVVGFGNPLCGDDGIGNEVIKYLEELDTDQGVETLDAGTSVWAHMTTLCRYDTLIIIDALVDDDGEDPPGKITRSILELDQGPPARAGAHDLGVVDMLLHMRASGARVPTTIFIGIQPKTIEPGITELSPEVLQSVPTVAAMVIEECTNALSN